MVGCCEEVYSSVDYVFIFVLPGTQIKMKVHFIHAAIHYLLHL